MFGDIFGDYCNANKHSLTSTFVRGLLTVDGGEQEEKHTIQRRQQHQTTHGRVAVVDSDWAWPDCPLDPARATRLLFKVTHSTHGSPLLTPHTWMFNRNTRQTEKKLLKKEGAEELLLEAFFVSLIESHLKNLTPRNWSCDTMNVKLYVCRRRNHLTSVSLDWVQGVSQL